MSDKSRTTPAAPPSGAARHRYPPDPQDSVAVQVVTDRPVRVNGQLWKPGQTLVLPRERIEAHNKAHGEPGRPIFQVVKTVHYVNGPPDQAEEPAGTGVLDLDAAT